MKSWNRILLPLALALGPTCGVAQQQGDPGFKPKIKTPSYPNGDGPVVAIDEGHNNFHTRTGRYAAFAKLLKADGYRVTSHRGRVSAKSLDDLRVLVIVNAIHESNVKDWKLPTPSAFTDTEIDSIVEFVKSGGSLFLIADHMPFPGAVEKLASRFGVRFENGFNVEKDAEGGFKVGRTIFRRKTRGIASHPITDGRKPAEKIHEVATFTGSVFRLEPATRNAKPLLVLREGTFVVHPKRAWKFEKDTPKKDVSGWLQGAAIEHGKGRVVVFAEAAMFTAQRRSGGGKMGMNTAAAKDNQQLARNILRWLASRPPTAKSESAK
jgi:uncharacterized protein (DUF2249 family)